MGMTIVGSINADLIAHVKRHPLPGETLGGAGALLATDEGLEPIPTPPALPPAWVPVPRCPGLVSSRLR